MTAKDKRQLAKALASINENITEVVGFLSQPMVSLDIIVNCLEWADSCYDGLVQGVNGARQDKAVDWQSFAALCWVKSDVGRVRDALRYCVQEQRAD